MDCAAENSGGLFGAGHTMGILADALQHAQLIFAVVNVTPAGVDEVRGDIASNVEQRCSTVPRLDDRARSIACARSRTGQRHAESSRNS